jgi:LysM repeat protein
MKRMSLLVFICVVLAATVTGCRLIAPTPDPDTIQRLVAEAVKATIEAMPTATPYPTYTPVPLAATDTPPVSANTPSANANSPQPTHTATIVPITPGSQSGSEFRTHVVVAGDTLSGLAKAYGTTVEAIMAANDLSNPSLIIIDQVLSIPVAEAESASTPATTTPSLTPTLVLTSTTTTPTATPTS